MNLGHSINKAIKALHGSFVSKTCNWHCPCHNVAIFVKKNCFEFCEIALNPLESIRILLIGLMKKNYTTPPPQPTSAARIYIASSKLLHIHGTLHYHVTFSSTIASFSPFFFSSIFSLLPAAYFTTNTLPTLGNSFICLFSSWCNSPPTFSCTP